MKLASIVSQVLAFCYPRACAQCGSWFEGEGILCEECERALVALEQRPRCGRCARPTGPGGACPRCGGRGLRPFERVLCMGVFDEPLRGLIHEVKYHQRWYLAEALADRLAQTPAVRALLAEVDCVAPVPLHTIRRLTRGYNQASVLAGRLRKVDRRIRVVRPAIRWRATRTQTLLTSAAARRENLRDAFLLVGPELIAGRRVLVVDDVLTSGATLQSFARALKEARPASLSALVLAVADPKGRGFERV